MIRRLGRIAALDFFIRSDLTVPPCSTVPIVPRTAPLTTIGSGVTANAGRWAVAETSASVTRPNVML
jgi:hypothetical protein